MRSCQEKSGGRHEPDRPGLFPRRHVQELGHGDRAHAALTLHAAAAHVREIDGVDPAASVLLDAPTIMARRTRAGDLGEAAWIEGLTLTREDAVRFALAAT